MTDTLLDEYIQRAGLVTYEDLARQMGTAKKTLLGPLVSMFEQKKIFFSYIVDGKETLLSRHLMFCLVSVRPDPMLSEPAQDILYWLSDNTGATREEMEKSSGLDKDLFRKSFCELMRKTQMTPVGIAETSEKAEDLTLLPLMEQVDFRWCSVEAWFEDLHRPMRYRDLEYSLSELTRLLSCYFDNAEINDILYNYR